MGVVKSSFFRLFVGGFVAGAIGVVALQPPEVMPTYGAPVASTTAR
jgi:hypothetical protein